MEHRSPDSGTSSGAGGIVVTPFNLNPVVQIVTWLLLALTSLMLCFRVLTRYFLKATRKVGWEDALVIVAYIFSTGESVTMLVPGSDIFGKEITQISTAQLKVGVKLGFARDLLLLFSLSLAKLSVTLGILALTPDKHHRLACYGLGIIIILWTITSVLTTAFQCGSQGPWDHLDGSRCINEQSFVRYVAIFNALTDIALVVLPVSIIWPLRMPLARRLSAMLFFCSRILVIAAIVFQLVYLPRLAETDWTLRAYPYFLSLQFIEFASISSACIVYFLPFFRSLETGLYGGAITKTSDYALSYWGGASKQTSTRRTADSPDGLNISTPGRRTRNYIKITTENSIITRSKSQENGLQPASNADLYPPNW